MGRGGDLARRVGDGGGGRPGLLTGLRVGEALGGRLASKVGFLDWMVADLRSCDGSGCSSRS